MKVKELVNWLEGWDNQMSIYDKDIQEALSTEIGIQISKPTKKEVKETLEELQWAYHTIDARLSFGLEESQAIIARERRIKSVLLDAIESLKEI